MRQVWGQNLSIFQPQLSQKKINDPVLVYNQGSQKTHSNNQPENHEFFIGSFMRTTGSLTFSNNWDQRFFDL